MGTRREARERAVQFLFQCDLNPPDDLETALRDFWNAGQPEPENRPDAPASPDSVDDGDTGPSAGETVMRLFAEQLVRGTLAEREGIDAHLSRLARNWAVSRMAVVDRNVLRMGMYELDHCRDIPAVVTINEAVEIAKRFSTEESGKFVNGILDNFRKHLKRDR
ncbi:MAG: transcription antitermination factor NusB [Verrucomicrobiae bacterium]|nr:transcription antitermination factor NusB [Verrucomicrobiae bacterium]MCP5521047.1 transcription antitermination factor NusB [Verrucomicrobiales bacterium]